MLISAIAFPAFLAFFLWLLPWLEERTLSAEERAQKIQRMLDEDSPDEIERRVTELLANSLTQPDSRRNRIVSLRSRG